MNKKILILFLLLKGLFVECFARAGGGGGHAGGGGHGGGGFRSSGRYYGRGGMAWQEGDGYRLILIMVIIVILFIVSLKAHRWLLQYKALKASKQISNSSQFDSHWDKEMLLDFIKQSYLRMQTSWMEQNMDLVQDIISPSLKGSYQKILDRQKRAGIYNFIDKVSIEDIKIIGVEDFIDNSQDSFTAYISGQMIDLLVRKNRKIIKASDSTEFEDIYHFKRHKNNWILTSISNNIDSWSIGNIKIVLEDESHSSG